MLSEVHVTNSRTGDSIATGAIIGTCILVLLEVAMNPTIKFSEDVVPLGDLKANPGKVVRRADETRRPVLVTSHGRGVAVVQGLSDFEAAQEERDFMRAVVAGLADLEDGRELPLADVKRRFGLA